MNEYRINSCVDIHDVDYNGVARASAVLKYMQSAAQLQLTESGMSYEALRARNRAFILSRVKLEIYEPLRAFASFSAASYPCESRGYSFLRCYSLEHNGRTVARAASVWALIDTEERSLVRVSDFELGLPLLPHNELTLGAMRMPVERLEDVGRYTVGYADTDQNRHMNNTRYPDMYASFLPMERAMIRSVTINYTNEAPMGECVTVKRAQDSGAYYFRTERSDGKINTDAKIELMPL